MPSTDVVFALGADDESESVIARLGERFPIRRKSGGPGVRTFFDTFDWRLHRHGMVLCAVQPGSGPRAGRFGLEVGAGGRPCRLRTRHLDFARNLPPGPIRAALLPLVGPRRLLPRAEVAGEETVLDLLDRRRRTVARIRLLAGAVRSPAAGDESRPLPPLLAIAAGRRRKAVAGIERLCGDELGLARLDGPLTTVLYRILGLEPGRDPSQLAVTLDPAAPASGALRTLLGALRAVVLANAEGVAGDLDPEFLHDFRVAVRRARSILGQLKQVLPAVVVNRLAPELTWLGRQTGPLRDLDVFLAWIHDQAGAPAGDLPPDLVPLLAHLHERRQIELHSLRRTLDSSRFRDLLRTWGDVAAGEVGDGGAALRASWPVREVVSARVRRVHARFIEQGRQIGPASSPGELHRLRIRGKKLRYLLDGFRSLYDAEAIAELIRHMKRLQDALGELHDSGVQAERLEAYLHYRAGEGAAIGTAPNVEGLIDRLRQRGREQREELAAQFAAFDHPATAALFLGL
ncbi:MAG: CHAD domain-containing protein [Planctomycetota bacterium]